MPSSLSLRCLLLGDSLNPLGGGIAFLTQAPPLLSPYPQRTLSNEAVRKLASPSGHFFLATAFNEGRIPLGAHTAHQSRPAPCRRRLQEESFLFLLLLAIASGLPRVLHNSPVSSTAPGIPIGLVDDVLLVRCFLVESPEDEAGCAYRGGCGRGLFDRLAESSRVCSDGEVSGVMCGFPSQ